MKKGTKLKTKFNAQLTLYLTLCLSLLFAACGTATPEQTAQEVMEGNERLATFGTAMGATGMDAELDGQPLTVFVPTLEAFEAYAEAQGLSLGELLASPQLGSVLEYHVAPGLFDAETLSTTDSVETLSGESIAVEAKEGGIVLNGASNVVEADIRARDTIIHVIDKVLEPPTEEPELDIVDIAASDERFSILVAALQKAELVDALKADGPFTVFAPTNAAFERLLGELDITAEELLASPDLEAILLYHVLGARVSAAEAAELDSATTVEGRDVAIETRDGELFINDSKVIQADVNASNGVIHAIDQVLLPPDDEALGTIPDIAAADERLTTLVIALRQADLVEALAAEGPFTVFAPTDEAFKALLNELGISAGELLGNPALAAILKYHVVPSKLTAADLAELDAVTTLEGSEVSVETTEGAVVLNGDITVIDADIEASNGVIHVIDGVLLPDIAPNLVDIVAGDERFSLFEAALNKTGVIDALKFGDPLTVLAPTNDAFVALADALGVEPEALLELPQLTDILVYHLVQGKALAEDIAQLETLTPVRGGDIGVEVVDGGIVLNGSVNVTEADLEASNGVVHVLDDVLLPGKPLPSIVELVVDKQRFSLLEKALGKAELVEALSAEGPFTVFAPTNRAFRALAHELHVSVEELLELPELADILLYHVASGKVTAKQAAELDSVTTLQGADIHIRTDAHGNLVLNNRAKVIAADFEASNGIVHAIDKVLLPPEN